MRIGTNGITLNQYNEILLILRDDTRTWALPAGGFEAGESLQASCAREVREETGIIVLPVRLVAIYYRQIFGGLLAFSFRCIQRGGELQPSEESPQVGFFPVARLPRPMLAHTTERIEIGWKHSGDGVVLNHVPMTLRDKVMVWGLQNVVYRWKNWQRRRAGNPYVPAPEWRVAACAWLSPPEGAGLVWEMRGDDWVLPMVMAEDTAVAPWEALAAKLGRNTICDEVVAVVVDGARLTLTLVLRGVLANSVVAEPWRTWEDIPPTAVDEHQRWVTAVQAAPAGEVLFLDVGD